MCEFIYLLSIYPSVEESKREESRKELTRSRGAEENVSPRGRFPGNLYLYHVTFDDDSLRTVGYVYSIRKRNSIKKSQLDRVENGHRRGGLRRGCLHLLDNNKKFSFLSTCRLPVEYLTDGRKLNLSEIRFKYIWRQCRYVRSIQFLSGYVTEL